MDKRVAPVCTVPTRETLTVVFLRNFNEEASGDAVIETAVGMTNAEGGTLYIGVDENGGSCGVKADERNDPEKIASFIASHTEPPLVVSVECDEIGGKVVLAVSVPQSSGIVATRTGKVLKRRLTVGKRPGTFPLYPTEFISRLSEIGRLDYTAMTLPRTSPDDLDAVERNRLRDFIRQKRGEERIAELEDAEFDKALGLVQETRDGVTPTVAGLLSIGKRNVIRRQLPGAGAVFEDFSGANRGVSEDFVLPLLDCLDALLLRFRARQVESEWMDGLVRVAVPAYSEHAFREALVNAFCHRDYARPGRISVRMLDDGLAITSPGGFMSGLTPETLLTAPSRSRNPLLAEIFRRIGLTESCGRGIERIAEGNLRYGRPLPDFSESDEETVRVVFPKCEADQEFHKFLIRSQRRPEVKIGFSDLLILSAIRSAGSLTVAGLLESTHLPERRIERHLRILTEKKLLEGVGNGDDREWMLKGCRDKEEPCTEASIRFSESNAERREALVLKWARTHSTLTRGDVMTLLGLEGQTVYRLLKRLVERGLLIREGTKRGSVYRTSE